MPVNGIELKDGQIWKTKNYGVVTLSDRGVNAHYPWRMTSPNNGDPISSITIDGKCWEDDEMPELLECIYNPEDKGEKKPMKFNPKSEPTEFVPPKPGDKIICNNGKEFICCTLGNLKSKGIASHLDDEVSIIFGISEHWEKNCSWMYWQVNNPLNDHEWKIREVIPQNLESSADKKEEVKEEPRYTVEEVLEAIQILTPMRCSWSWVPEIKKHLNKVKDPQYLEYLRLKAIYE